MQAAENVMPVAVTAAESVERLWTWANGHCLSADRRDLALRIAALSPLRRIEWVLLAIGLTQSNFLLQRDRPPRNQGRPSSDGALFGQRTDALGPLPAQFRCRFVLARWTRRDHCSTEESRWPVGASVTTTKC